jgi:hypothetical protein
LTLTLFITFIIESVFIIGFAFWGKKPIKSILFTSICGNLITQSLLWIVLNLFFQYYLVTLLIAEILIWVIETVLLYAITVNQLSFKEATFLSLGMNALSFAVGWFLPV